MTDVTLYDRDPNYIPRVAAVHDMCGYGKCSLTAAIPILSAAGCDVCPVPTALFSAHTRYAVFTFHDTSAPPIRWRSFSVSTANIRTRCVWLTR